MRYEGGCEKQFSLQTHRDHMKSAERMTLRLVGVIEATQAVCSPGGILNAGEHSRIPEMVQTVWYTKACLCALCVYP